MPMKQKSVKQLKADADKWFSKYVRYRDGAIVNGEWVARCITCFTSLPVAQMQAGHFQSRRFNSLRFDEENVNAQCVACNVFRYGEQFKYAKELDLKYGEGTSDRLAERRHELHKYTRQELQEIIDEAKAQIKYYEDSGDTYNTKDYS